MIQSIAIQLLMTAIGMLVPYDLIGQLKAIVISLLSINLTGAEKKAKLLETLKAFAGDVAGKAPAVETWLMNLAIEVVVTWAKNKYPSISALVIASGPPA